MGGIPLILFSHLIWQKITWDWAIFLFSKCFCVQIDFSVPSCLSFVSGISLSAMQSVTQLSSMYILDYKPQKHALRHTHALPHRHHYLWHRMSRRHTGISSGQGNVWFQTFTNVKVNCSLSPLIPVWETKQTAAVQERYIYTSVGQTDISVWWLRQHILQTIKGDFHAIYMPIASFNLLFSFWASISIQRHKLTLNTEIGLHSNKTTFWRPSESL